MTEPASHFTEMAERIAKIDPKEFAGAVVVVPPGDGKVIAFLYADPSPDAAQFYGGLSARVEIAAAEAKDAESQRQPGWPRR